MKVTAKVSPVNVIQFMERKFPEACQEASVLAVQTASGPLVGDLQDEYKNLPVKHVQAQQRNQSRPARRISGEQRPHVWQDIRLKADKYRQLFGAWAVTGATTRQPHLHWIEAGTTERRHKSGHPTGRMPAFRVVLKVRTNREKFIVDTVHNTFVAKFNSMMGR